MTLQEDLDFFGYVYDLFCEFGQKKPGAIDLTFSRKIDYPLIVRFPEISIKMPLPRFRNGLFYFEGFVFEDTLDQRFNLWSLFLASIYHLASHAAVSRYSLYEKWIENKTEEVYSKVIDFIEDSFVERYISCTNNEVWQSLEEIKATLENSMDVECATRDNGFAFPAICSAKESFILKIKQNLAQIEIGPNSDKNVIEIADMLYRNRQLLPKYALPYVEHGKFIPSMTSGRDPPEFPLVDEFKETAYRLDELWDESERSRAKLLKQYGKFLKGLQFDSVSLSQENYHEFIETREEILPMVRRIRQQIRTIVNVTDSPKMDEVGLVDMQMAIQSIASKGRLTEVFERVEDRRAEEAWIILIDKSASMRLRFDHIKEFAVCVAEAANELTGKSGAWAMYSFDNNFQIIKDFKEKYGRQVQARLGGLENSGLSLLPDAIEISHRILDADQREKKFLFVITDGHPSGYNRIHEQFSKIAKKVEISGIILVAIGVSKSTSKKFRNSARGTDLKQLVAKFITAYRTASSDM